MNHWCQLCETNEHPVMLAYGLCVECFNWGISTEDRKRVISIRNRWRLDRIMRESDL